MSTVTLLDANTIWSAAVRDTLLLAAESRLYRPAWTLQILDEMARNLKEKRPDLSPLRIDRTIKQMLTFFPDALVQEYEELIPLMTNHQGDRHVLAAAVHAGASVIVTWNKADFPTAACVPYSIEVQTPDEFLCLLWQRDRIRMLEVLEEQSSHLVNPPQTLLQVLETLRRSVPTFVETVLLSGLFSSPDC